MYTDLIVDVDVGWEVGVECKKGLHFLLYILLCYLNILAIIYYFLKKLKIKTEKLNQYLS